MDIPKDITVLTEVTKEDIRPVTEQSNSITRGLDVASPSGRSTIGYHSFRIITIIIFFGNSVLQGNEIVYSLLSLFVDLYIIQ